MNLVKQKTNKKMPKKSRDEMPELQVGYDENLRVRQPSVWDKYRFSLDKPGAKLTGFRDGAQAAQCAQRMRNTWDMKEVRSWVDVKEGPTVGIPVNKSEEEEETDTE